MGRSVAVPAAPQRIVSLVPSQTELLADLGLGPRVAGITKFCVRPPEWRRQKAVVGGTKQFRFEAIEALRPDLILGNKEENYEAGIRRLEAGFPVWMSDVYTLADALRMIREVGALTGTADRAEGLAGGIEEAFAAWKAHREELPRPRVLYLIWREPYMAAGTHTFVHSMLEEAGFENALETPRYPALTPEEMRRLDPDWVLLSSEPYPFGERHLGELQGLLPRARIRLADGEAFSWYGSRLLQAPAYFGRLRSEGG
jgi:ABC-type Fe3+-hydroxamate transport system substrate-binding protein